MEISKTVILEINSTKAIFLKYLFAILSSYWSDLFLGYKPKPKAKKERTEEEKKFRRRTKYFLATQLVAVLVFLSIMGGVDSSELEDEYDVEYED
jgi:hypothetical protein